MERNSMANLDWSQCPVVESVPGKVSGAWVFKDTRMPVATVFENLEAGLIVEEVMEEISVTREQMHRHPPMLVLIDRDTPRSIARFLHAILCERLG
jgi:uncharacterized protein (DUF433 family)